MLYLNEEPVKVTIFPDKTSQVWKVNGVALDGPAHTIWWDYEHEAEFIHLLQLVDLINTHNTIKTRRIVLKVPYLPFARQDKHISNDTTFALNTIASILDNVGFDSIHTIDAHSAALEKLLIKTPYYNKSPIEYVNFAATQCLSDVIGFPDAGALERYSYSILADNHRVIGNKVRDQQTGLITHYNIIGDCKDKIVLIVDDICDGGATFILMAKALYQAGAKAVHLYVTHGIFSKGLGPLFESGIRRIFTRNGEIAELDHTKTIY